jgi:BirA family biotin operon repressor/biotin-[acetyl-CoA-carboxylase] ligase
MAPAPICEHVHRIDSTNAELMRRPFGAEPQPPHALLADQQTAGRGRNGRAWATDPSASLALSVALERHIGAPPLLGLPLAAGVAVARVLAEHGAAVRLKWPNDLLVDTPAGRAKAGGILVEMRSAAPLQRVVIGVGLNLAPSAALAAVQAAQPVAALFGPGDAPPREALARALAAALIAMVDEFERGGLAAFAARWAALDALADAPVTLLRPDGSRSVGVAQGIDADGALRVALPCGGLERVVAGDVSVRAGHGIESG